MAAELLPTAIFSETQFKNGRNWPNYCPKPRASANFSLRASQEPLDDDKNKFYRELGLLILPSNFCGIDFADLVVIIICVFLLLIFFKNSKFRGFYGVSSVDG